jgi:hypothetical protein
MDEKKEEEEDNYNNNNNNNLSDGRSAGSDGGDRGSGTPIAV